MKNNMIAGLAGALLLSTAGFAFAAQGTTVVPAGQDASSVKMAQAETPAADAPAAADPSAAETSAPATSDAAPADAGGASVAGISNPEPDAHPSADTQAETNKVASINPNDASEDPGLALDTAEKPV